MQKYRGRAVPRRTWDPNDLVGVRLGIYSRASDDRDDTETSVTAQSGFGVRWAESQGISDVTMYCDNDLSASEYATKERADFAQLIEDINAGRLDLIWFWTLSRQQRRLDVYVELRNLCRAKGVGWVIKRRVYDLNDSSDLRALGMDAVNAETFSIELSETITLGMELSASLGRPHGPLTYGYRREYDSRGKYIGQYPDENEVESPFVPGSIYRKAEVVREIIRNIAKHTPIRIIQKSLATRGIPSPKGKRTWSRSVITRLAVNPTYLGKRIHRGEVLDHPEPCWEPIMKTPEDVEAFYIAGNVLADPARMTTRPGAGKHLVSYNALCDNCEENSISCLGTGADRLYRCSTHGCCSINADVMDAFVRAVIDGYLARSDVRAALGRGSSADPGVAAAHAEAERLRGELQEYKALAAGGGIAAVDYAEIAQGLRARIDEQTARAKELALPSALRSLKVDWEDIPAARQAIAALAEIRIKRVGKGGRNTPLKQRIGWRWLIGPDAA